MSPSLESFVSLVGRLLMSTIFLVSGIGKLMNWSGNLAYMESQGMPPSDVLLGGAVVAELVLGTALLLGFQTRWVALLLFLYLIPTTLIFHNFWAVAEPAARQNQMIHFLKNLAIWGGLLKFAAAGADAYSLDAALARNPSVGGAFRPNVRHPA
jgi:putative oxidoreductase